MQILNFDLEQEAWMEEGSCVYANTELFFPVGSSMKAIKQANEAKAVCNECVVKIDCLNMPSELTKIQVSGVERLKKKENLFEESIVRTDRF